MTQAYAEGTMSFEVLRSVAYGGQEYEGDFHFTGFTPASMSELLIESGFVEPKSSPKARPNGDCLEFEIAATPSRWLMQRLGRHLHAQPGGQPPPDARVPAPSDATATSRWSSSTARPPTTPTQVLARVVADSVRIERCPVPNLSVSRNIGIRAAAGDIVAFIDDDALPEFDWLDQALPAFDDPEVAGVGGIVFDHTGHGAAVPLQRSEPLRRDRRLRQDRPYDEQCVPGSFQFPYLQGTNALFRRDALLRVGGFDETYDYYLDETDLCCRLIDAGYVLRQLPNAPVHHKFLPSGIRDHQRVVTNWFPIMKNQVYFSYRHALDPFTSTTSSSTRGRSSRVESKTLGSTSWRADCHRMPPTRLPSRAPRRSASVSQLGMERFHLRLGPVQWDAPAFQPLPDDRQLASPQDHLRHEQLHRHT